MSKLVSTAEFENLRKTLLDKTDPEAPCITICSGTGCHAYGCGKVSDAFKQEIKKKKLGRKVKVRTTGCHGFCERGPLVVIYPKKIFYQRVGVKDVPEVISETIMKGNLVERLLYVDPDTKEKIVYEDDVPFYKKQQRLIFGNNGIIDPTSIDDYLVAGGYTALAKVLNGMSSKEVISTVKEANLRGRGGGGFPAGVKWESCHNAEGDERYVICNADEGDPGAYMDRSLLEGNPHSVLEGMIIGAYAIGSSQGYVYVRNEYPLAVSNLTVAIKQAEKYGLLGDDILGSGFSFKVHISKGGGAFVCGESSALTASLEGNVGEPKAKHIHTVVSGFRDKPTTINNVETWANVPLIIDKGAEWYKKIGTEGSKGTKIFSLVGKVNNTGLVEVPMGISLREIIYDIGGGVPGGKKFKAVQTGGPSGGCIPEEHLDLPVDFDRLYEVGSMMGSGGMIVMDERNCMVDVAKYFLNFLKDESCGKCTSCREGTERLHEIVTNITLGKGKESDIKLLEELGEVIVESSLCALGGTAPYPLLSTLRYFRDEYEAHIKDKRCPAGVCKELTTFLIVKEKCIGCGRCKVVCPSQAVTGAKKKLHKIIQKKCVKCGACYENCKFDAVKVK
jgi:NADH:ubiquinone oxidoreductase subunit F (NADH-binding)/(2Fe-2S) ferredoxin/Pyruvate/2-oxoacid:ferredoxin oxidoreductase delta subunit